MPAVLQPSSRKRLGVDTRNGNYKGGISRLRDADSILDLGSAVVEDIRLRIADKIIVDQVTGCWLWTGPVFDCNGRACINLGVRQSASRVSYVVHKGSTGGLDVLHTCDNVLCVAPDHLWLGTPKQNSEDMIVKGRSLKGEDNSAAILTEDQVRWIKSQPRFRGMCVKYGKMFNVSSQCIYYIVTGKSWAHV